MAKSSAILTCILGCAILIASSIGRGQASPTPALPDQVLPEKVIIDTDIGDDVDDAFALALALRSPELQILGITTTFGDTETRAKLDDRFLAEVGCPQIPVSAGKPTPVKGTFTQRRYADLGYTPPRPPQPEWNILNDIPSAQKLFASGVPLFVMPLDSTQLKLDEVKRAFLFSQGTPLTDALTLLYHQWGQETPTLFDPMTIAFLVNPSLCPVQPMHIRVDEKGFTRPESGPRNAQVCLDSSPDAFFRFLLSRLIYPEPPKTAP